jgi:hypothetical protein
MEISHPVKIGVYALPGHSVRGRLLTLRLRPRGDRLVVELLAGSGEGPAIAGQAIPLTWLGPAHHRVCELREGSRSGYPFLQLGFVRGVGDLKVEVLDLAGTRLGVARLGERHLRQLGWSAGAVVSDVAAVA